LISQRATRHTGGTTLRCGARAWSDLRDDARHCPVFRIPVLRDQLLVAHEVNL
jgi:hypothetical protein